MLAKYYGQLTGIQQIPHLHLINSTKGYCLVLISSIFNDEQTTNIKVKARDSIYYEKQKENIKKKKTHKEAKYAWC